MAPELMAVLALVVLALVVVGRAVRVIQQSTNVTIESLPEVAAGDANKLLLLPTGAADAMGAPPPPTRPDGS